MNTIIKNITGMGSLSDQVIATDFLVSAKSAVLNYSAALTETFSPDLRITLSKQLNDAIDTHETVANYMIKMGYYHPYLVHEQLKVDMQASDTALNLKV
ncbi:MAG: spore coat protein [Bacillota bacterium]|nr:spore coat protein [Bacillota bacterium]